MSRSAFGGGRGGQPGAWRRLRCAAARASGCSERKVFTVSGAHFDWSGVLGAAQAMSLFAERQLIEIRIPSGKPGKDGADALQRYCKDLPPDVVTLVQVPKLDYQQLKTAWFAALEAAGTTVDVERLRQNTRYQAIAPSLLGDQRRGAGALGVVALTASR